MKKTLIAVVLGCAAILSARDIKDNLDKAKIGANIIPGWTINRSSKAADYGKGKIIVGSEADEKAFQFQAPADRSNSFYMLGATPVKVGEFLEFSAEVKGKGTVTISYYAYSAKNGFLTGIKIPYKTFTLTNDWQEIECKLPIVPSTKGTVALIRPSIRVSQGGLLVIEDIDLEIDND